MDKHREVLILGGGLAGLTAAIHLSQIGVKVIVLEKNDYPKHKVCGEYISNEVLPYLAWLQIDLAALHPTTINKFTFSTSNGKTINSDLPLGGFGISRYVLDNYLLKRAINNGCTIIQEAAESIVFNDDTFTIVTSENKILNANIVIGAFGKRSNLDLKINRNFINQKSPWLAVKAHYSGDFPNDLVGLHNFKGGYCGISKVENNKVNICYLADFESFKSFKNIEDYQKNILQQNPNLKTIFENHTLLFEKPLTISQICFEPKQSVENHILMIGDTAGLIHPLCGNGMAMAIHSAKIVSEAVSKYLSNEIISRSDLEKNYTKEWNFNFKKRLKTARFLASVLQKQKYAHILMSTIIYFPFLLPMIIKKTHGKPLILNH